MCWLSFAVAPVFLDVFSTTEVTYDGLLSLSCRATATPRPDISWYYKDNILMSGVDSVMISGTEMGERILESTMMIMSLFIDRSGSYSCHAENVVDSVTSTVEVIIYCELCTHMYMHAHVHAHIHNIICMHTHSSIHTHTLPYIHKHMYTLLQW